MFMPRFTRLSVALAAVAVAHGAPAAAQAYSDCGDPAGPASNVTATGVSCADARSFARKAAERGVTRSGTIRLAGWRPYTARVRRTANGYDVRATRGSKVIRFQYSVGSSKSSCDPNYEGACLDPTSPDYDCAGGSGNGPDYTGPVRVVGDDHFGLDADGDGEGCE
jgi:hypothetical protein